MAPSRDQPASAFILRKRSALPSKPMPGKSGIVGDDLEGGRLVVAAPEAWSIDLEIRLYRDHAVLGKAAEAFWLAARAGAKAG